MSDPEQPRIGTVGWFDLTVSDAENVKDFYAAVTGWKPSPVDMGGYNDFNMTLPDNGDPVAGICHALGGNANLPATWLIYITVEDVDASAEICRQLGGQVVAAPRDTGDTGRYCLIQDPAGAIAALFAYKK